MGFLSSVTGEASKTAKKTRRKERRAQQTASNLQANQLKRQKEVFMEDAERQKLMLNEQLAARGMSFGTHADSERAFQDKAVERGLADISDRTKLQNVQDDLMRYQHKTRNRANPLKILDFATELAETGLTMGMGGMGGGLPAMTGTQGLDQAIW